jgi:mono/diheme cytochrome c family protein
MKQGILKICGFILLALLLAGGLWLFRLGVILPDVGRPPVIHISLTSGRIVRGAYLVQHVARCIDCHSERDLRLTAGPMVPGTLGQGGERFDASNGMPGVFVAKNITPYHLAGWTDGQIFRAITEGVSRDGKALFPAMPYLNYGLADSMDICAIIAYLRTIPAIKKDPEPSRADFPMNWKINTLPARSHLHPAPPEGITAAYGKYLLLLANCQGCHAGNLSGGVPFPLPTGGQVNSANISPDPVTGIGSWTLEDFIRKFKSYSDSSFRPVPIGRDQYNSAMPWTFFTGMSVSDISALYTYLRTVPPVHHVVVKFQP